MKEEPDESKVLDEDLTTQIVTAMARHAHVSKGCIHAFYSNVFTSNAVTSDGTARYSVLRP